MKMTDAQKQEWKEWLARIPNPEPFDYDEGQGLSTPWLANYKLMFALKNNIELPSHITTKDFQKWEKLGWVTVTKGAYAVTDQAEHLFLKLRTKKENYALRKMIKPFKGAWPFSPWDMDIDSEDNEDAAGLPNNLPNNNDIDEQFEADAPLIEGSLVEVKVNKYERNPKARALCIAHHGYSCSVCGFNFGKNYGSVADGLIHVHHLIPVATIGEAYEIDPIKDLRPVCANCHAVIHKRQPPYTIEEMLVMLKKSY